MIGSNNSTVKVSSLGLDSLAHLEDREHWRRLKALDAVAFNALAEAAFLAGLSAELHEEDGQSIISVASLFARRLDVSVETVKRYLLKYSSREGPFRVAGGRVWLLE